MNAVDSDNQYDQRFDNVDAYVLNLMELSDDLFFFFNFIYRQSRRHRQIHKI